MTDWSTDTLILEPDRYAEVRREQRAVAMELRRQRRVPLGDMLVVEFENAETLRYQAQEMLYVERVTDAGAAAAEVSAYDRLLPTPRSLSATLLIEIADQEQVRAELQRLDGLHQAVRLEIGGRVSAGQDVPPPDEGPSQRTFSVHFLRFDLTAEAVEALGRGEPARLVVDHPEYRAQAALSTELESLLDADLHQPTNTKGE